MFEAFKRDYTTSHHYLGWHLSLKSSSVVLPRHGFIYWVHHPVVLYFTPFPKKKKTSAGLSCSRVFKWNLMTAPSSLNSALLICGRFFLDVDIQDISFGHSGPGQIGWFKAVFFKIRDSLRIASSESSSYMSLSSWKAFNQYTSGRWHGFFHR